MFPRLDFALGRLLIGALKYGRMWRISVEFLNYFPFRFYSYYTAEKQPNRVPGITYPFELKGCAFHTYANKNEGQP